MYFYHFFRPVAAEIRRIDRALPIVASVSDIFKLLRDAEIPLLILAIEKLDLLTAVPKLLIYSS
jgi:hypothetical protein